MKRKALLLTLVFSLAAAGAEKSDRIILQVVDNFVEQQQFNLNLPATATATTTCGNNSCTTSVTAYPPTTIPFSSTQNFANVIIRPGLPDAVRVVLHCQARRCSTLAPGYYPAEAKGTKDHSIVWVTETFNGKTGRVKYRIEGVW